ncbi:MAG: hypothetical protein E7599_03865 [Ruminococcaceae bacterium]|nr:hypothetical protein [Oscillospiraceae bacterium]
MRNLTIKRNKSFVASLGKITFYIEDPNSDELVINGTPCRTLCMLKNGESKTFEIEDCALKVFATPFKNKKYTEKNYFDYFKIPEGSDDWYLSGGCQFNPGAGNPFLFDNVTDEEILAHRKTKGKKSILVSIVAVILGLATGFGISYLFSDTPDPKDFTTDDFTITLTDEYKEADPTEWEDKFAYVFESDYAYVTFIRDDFSLMAGLENYTIEQYVDMVAWGNDQSTWELKTQNGMDYYDYKEKIDGEEYMYLVTFHKDKDCFWLVQYMTYEENYKEMKPDFIKHSKSLTFHE